MGQEAFYTRMADELASIDDADFRMLGQRAIEMTQKAYTPFSLFNVGAALLTERGTLALGCNVDNASYGLSNCGERTAIFNAVAQEGKTMRVAKIAVIAEADTASPCGACRQVLSEFGSTTQVMFVKEGHWHITNLGELLPTQFVFAPPVAQVPSNT